MFKIYILLYYFIFYLTFEKCVFVFCVLLIRYYLSIINIYLIQKYCQKYLRGKQKYRAKAKRKELFSKKICSVF